MATPLSAQSAAQAIAGAHSRFHAAALARLQADIAGPARNRALTREQQRGAAYVANARRRLTDGFREIAADGGEDAELRRRALLALERRYLNMHLAESARRMQGAADLSILEQAGDPDGYWEMAGGPHKHCSYCLRYQGRAYPIWWLRENGPSSDKVHGGCLCRVRSVASARQRGLVFREADLDINSKSDLVEAVVRVPAFGSWDPEKHPRGDRGQWAPVTHDLHPSFHHGMNRLVNALGSGDVDEAEEEAAKLRDHAASRFPEPGTLVNDRTQRQWEDASDQMDHLERVLTRVFSASIDPEHSRTLGGARIHEREGITEPWAPGGRFAWEFPRGTVPDQLVGLINSGRMESFKVGRSGDHIVLSSTPKDVVLARGATRQLESQFPQLRAHRIADIGERLEDDRPLDIGKDEAVLKLGKKDRMSVYAGVTGTQLGDAGEILSNAAAQRLQELKLVKGDDVELASARQGSPLDWVVGDLAIEVKTVPLRGYTVGTMSPSPKITSPQMDIKTADMLARNAARRRDGQPPLRAAQVQAWVDLDADVGHLFVHVYPDDSAQFGSLRVPREMIDSLIGEGLTPGQAVTASSGAHAGDPAHAWTYLGAVRLPVNPMHPAYQGRRLDPAERSARADVQPRFVDEGVPENVERVERVALPLAPEPELRKPDDVSERDELLKHLYHHGRHESGRQLTLGEIGKQMGDMGHGKPGKPVPQSTVTRWLKDLGIQTGRGARRDRPPEETKQQAIVRLADSGHTPEQIARDLRVTRTLVDRVLGRERPQLGRGEVAESGGEASSSPEVPSLRLVS